MAGAQKKKHAVLLSDEPVSTSKSGAFFGYAPLTSNVTYTPNQFFDVCLSRCSAPCVKLVGYMLRRHFGWVDAYGKPQEEQLVIGYADLQSAGVPRGHIREAIDEAIDRKFINCVRKARRAEKGKSPISGLYELRFDDGADYIKNPDAFDGFFDGDGHFTYVPNQFYDVCLREELLSVIKAVGTVIRFSIGFKVRRGGGRRQLAKVALSFIQNYSNMSRPSAVSALKKAVERNHLVRFQQGIFSPDKATQMAASYGLKWTDKEPIDYTFKNISEKAAPKFNQEQHRDFTRKAAPKFN